MFPKFLLSLMLALAACTDSTRNIADDSDTDSIVDTDVTTVLDTFETDDTDVVADTDTEDTDVDSDTDLDTDTGTTCPFFVTWYVDGDDDGLGNELLSTSACVTTVVPQYWSLTPGDCDDSDPLVGRICADTDVLDTGPIVDTDVDTDTGDSDTSDTDETDPIGDTDETDRDSDTVDDSDASDTDVDSDTDPGTETGETGVTDTDTSVELPAGDCGNGYTWTEQGICFGLTCYAWGTWASQDIVYDPAFWQPLPDLACAVLEVTPLDQRGTLGASDHTEPWALGWNYDQGTLTDVSGICPAAADAGHSFIVQWSWTSNCEIVDEAPADTDDQQDTDPADTDADTDVDPVDTDIDDPCVQIEWLADDDGDGLGDESDTVLACDQPAGYVSVASGYDCDPLASSVLSWDEVALCVGEACVDWGTHFTQDIVVNSPLVWAVAADYSCDRLAIDVVAGVPEADMGASYHTEPWSFGWNYNQGTSTDISGICLPARSAGYRMIENWSWSSDCDLPIDAARQPIP